MKKILFLAALVCAMTGVTSCNSCKKGEEKPANVDTVLVVEGLIKADRDAMAKDYKDDYRWYETCIVLQDFYDEEGAAEPTVTGVSNIFQFVVERDKDCYDTQVVLYAHVKDTCVVEVKQGFWVGDKPLNDEQIKLTFKDAYDKMMATNLPKPHSRQCVLRKELGPKDCNPQYIFGNVKAQIYVDAVTGNVTDKNPAYEGVNLGTPLGEWP